MVFVIINLSLGVEKIMERFIGIIGIVIIFLIVFLMSNNKKAINYKTIGIGFVLQWLLAIFIFKVPLGQKIFLC